MDLVENNHPRSFARFPSNRSDHEVISSSSRRKPPTSTNRSNLNQTRGKRETSLCCLLSKCSNNLAVRSKSPLSHPITALINVMSKNQQQLGKLIKANQWNEVGKLLQKSSFGKKGRHTKTHCESDEKLDPHKFIQMVRR